MLQDGEQFAAALTDLVLRADDEDIQAEVLGDLMQRAERSGSLDVEIARSREVGRRSGDFGMEIVGPLLIPILIEAGKHLWAAYVKELGDKAASGAATATVDGARALVRRMWRGDEVPVGPAQFEAAVRAAAAKEGLPANETDALVARLRAERVVAALRQQGVA